MIEFILLGLTLAGVMIYHNRSFTIAFIGMVTIVTYKLFFTDFNLPGHALHEWPILTKLLFLLVGFGLMGDHFKESRLALKAPRWLPNNWLGPFLLLVLVFILSMFLDNIASAKIGDLIAKVVFKGNVTVGYLGAIVGASNAGGAPSAIGDTTSTMMWLKGLHWTALLPAIVGSVVALITFGIPLAIKQQKHQAIVKDEIPSHGSEHARVDYARVAIVVIMLVGVIAGNIVLEKPEVGLWAAIIATAAWRKPALSHIPGEAKNASFLLMLVFSASMMPISTLPPASPGVVFALGGISGLFDNIPLTQLAITMGGFFWAMLAYAVGFGGSTTWFGSSAGVAVAANNPDMKKMSVYFKEATIWIFVAYCAGFLAMYLVFGWQPSNLPG
jgi:Na+/H+ antiporter NhaD/arsenite permease-like protein